MNLKNERTEGGRSGRVSRGLWGGCDVNRVPQYTWLSVNDRPSIS
jgi:hypothetical protein